jgi:hypothetical protein
MCSWPEARWRLWGVGLLLVGGIACHRGEPPKSPPGEVLEDVAVVRFPSPEPELEPATPLDLTPDPLLEGVAAMVDGVPILEAEVERLVRAAEPAHSAVRVRTEALMQLVERRLIESEADQLDIRVSDEEVERALAGVAANNRLTIDELAAEVTLEGWSWEEYQQELVGQLLEVKVLSVHGAGGGAGGGAGAGAGTPEALVAFRRQFLGCMRARAEIQLGDEEAIVLPENAFARVAEIAQFRFSGDVGLPEAELEVVARKAAQSRVRLF